MSAEGLNAAQAKMRDGGVHPTAIDVFSHYYKQLESGVSGLIHEADLAPMDEPVQLADLPLDDEAGGAALDVTAVIKLNGGLGTSMGMERAKTLLPVRDGLNFLDIIARQVLHARRRWSATLPLVFMNSFRTRDDTIKALSAYTDLALGDLPLDFMQNREPKLLVDDLTPASWPDDPTLEWCPPGHGDLYTGLSASGILRQLLDEGYRFAFASNADNLRATVDPRVAGWFASSGAPFANEVCRRTPADRKGGHLAVRTRDGQLVLRESAQTAPEDAEAFADISRHRYFNTNNLWIDLEALDEALSENDGVLELPIIRNEKTVDPSDENSPKVIQIETAMGAAVEMFSGAQAIAVDRGRFLPVKSTEDLLILRSDVYALDDDSSIVFAEGIDEAPHADLDPAYYKGVSDFDARFPDGPPSLADASSLSVRGDWTFGSEVVVRGAAVVGPHGSPGTISHVTIEGDG
ncbi:MAG: UTP--glucose-1-phosphate uridylyltransferase [Nocardioidaceae bacterium]